jgi:hypothetical protein
MTVFARVTGFGSAALCTFTLLAAPSIALGQVGSSALRVKGVTGPLQLRNTIIVEVDSLQQFLQEKGRDASKFVLYLDWRPIKGLEARAIPGTNRLAFDVRRSADTKSTWDQLLGSPLSKGFSYPIAVSVGYDTEAAIRSDVRQGLLIISPIEFMVYVGAFLLAFALFVLFARTSSIIRDARRDVPAVKRPPYSLGKSQMAFWFFLILASYVLIWIVTGEPPAVTESVLALMGISAATALGSVVVSSSKEQDTESQVNKLLQEREQLAARNTAVGVQAASPEEKAKNEERIKRIDMALNQESAGFWKDLLTDVDGISLHRFQIVIWTIVLGWIFVVAVYKSLGMPEFGPTLVALMGISAGTYIGFKFPEKQV